MLVSNKQYLKSKLCEQNDLAAMPWVLDSLPSSQNLLFRINEKELGTLKKLNVAHSTDIDD